MFRLVDGGTREGGPAFRLPPDGWLALGLTLPLMTAIAAAAGLPALTAAAVLGGLAAVALACFARTPHGRFGLANGVTLSRLQLAGLVFLTPLAESGAASWTAVGFAGSALALDAVDGWAARRLHQATSFGARFDMETDTLLLAALAALGWLCGRTGIWVLAAPLMRPLFVLAATVWPWLRHPLPPSGRRKLCCALPMALLIMALVPVLPPALAEALAAGAVGLLAWSFAVDVAWLRARRGA